MARTTSSADIERLQRRRTRLAIFQGLLFVIWQVNFFADVDGRAVSYVKFGAYFVWLLLLLAFLATGGSWAYPRDARAILNDETTVEHRRRAIIAGFWAAMATALGLQVLSLFEALPAGQALHYVLTLGVGTALLAFGILERRAQRDG
jgi:hypothetical protein